MSKWHGGKGSKKRPMQIDKEQFDKNFEAIFGKKKKEEKDGDKAKTEHKDQK
jgi:hypothetical protein